MNENQRPDESTLGPDDAFVYQLEHTRPKADRKFQQDLEHQLMAQLHTLSTHKRKEKPSMQYSITSRRTRFVRIAPVTWAATLTALMVGIISVALVLFRPEGSAFLSNVPPMAVQVENEGASIVIATQNIPAGTVITEAMIGVISLSSADLDELRSVETPPEFITDASLVIGETAAFNIEWFQPIAADQLGEPFDPCAQEGAACPEIPEDYFAINLPVALGAIEGLNATDRVDVLAAVDGQIRVVVEDVLLADVSAERITLAAPSWKHSILIWLYQSGESYALRLHTPESEAEVDLSPVEFTFTAPQELPEDYQFDLVIGVPASLGYTLTNLPASIDHIDFTGPEGMLNFWFEDIEVVSIVDGVNVTVRMPRADAENLEYLFNLEAQIQFIPDQALNSQP